MFFTKFPYKTNFSFASAFDSQSGSLTLGSRQAKVSLRQYQGGLIHVQVENDKIWGPNGCLESLDIPKEEALSLAKLDAKGNFHFADDKSGVKFTAHLGLSGEQSMFEIELGKDPKFYGMGEKYFGVQELSGYRTKYYNTDVWSDFHSGQWGGSPSDPPYFSTPYVVAKIGKNYVGFLLHNPYPAFMETPGIDEARVFVEWQRTAENLQIGNEGGQPNLWILVGPTLAELTQKLQKLVGVTPRPPLWSLGYQQSRWGYGGHHDLLELDKKFAENKIPCTGLWLDLDYMDGFRIFKTSKKAFPKGAQVTADQLAKNGRRIVPIIDPGVKFEKGYAVYEDGHAKGVFCKNAEDREFIGLVWPGETVFPDFTLLNVRDWWKGYTEQFRKDGFGACWIDMNDPSTGPVDPNDMLFNYGKEPHAAHRNQFSLGMQMATKAGFLQAKPNERPFILSRSGYIGSSKHTAIWTGDNLSNYFYLKISITTGIGMSLSGLPFSGPDVGGFGGDVTDELMVDWMKANFLFPFCRNHSKNDVRKQEPFAFKKPVMEVLRKYIQLRHKLVPYLYNLFVQSESAGDPILRPLIYHYDQKGLDQVNDQFLIGDAILQAPFVEEGEKQRKVTLPGKAPWFDLNSGEWLEPGSVKVKKSAGETPIYVRSGAILPMHTKTPTLGVEALDDVVFHLFLGGKKVLAETEYVFDDGLTFDYQNGKQSRLKIQLVSTGAAVEVKTKWLEEGAGKLKPKFIVHGPCESLTLDGKPVALKPTKVTYTGKPLNALKS